MGPAWESLALTRALPGSRLLTSALLHLRKRVSMLAGMTGVHSWGSRGRGFKSRRPDQNLQVRASFRSSIAASSGRPEPNKSHRVGIWLWRRQRVAVGTARTRSTSMRLTAAGQPRSPWATPPTASAGYGARVTGKTKTAVRDKLKVLHRELEAGIQSSASYTMALCIEDWLSQGLAGRSASTIANYPSATARPSSTNSTFHSSHS